MKVVRIIMGIVGLVMLGMLIYVLVSCANGVIDTLGIRGSGCNQYN